MLGTKCVAQSYDGGDGLHNLLCQCLTVTYNAIAYAKEKGIENRKGMKRFYRSLKDVELPSCYKVAAITRACAVVKSRKKSDDRGTQIRHPKPLRPTICIISGFFVTMKGRFFIPLRRERYFDIQLNRYVVTKITAKKLRSLTITPGSLSFCYSEEVGEVPIRTVFGVDRNEKNLTFGNRGGIVQVDMTKAVKIRRTTREIVSSFRRNDVRVRRNLARRCWRRATHRTDQLLHAATNFMVDTAMRDGAALALEDITNIRRMYGKGNGQGPDYRFRLNSWPHRRAKQMIEYKAAWKGVAVISLTKSETRGSSSVHWACGEKLHDPERGDAVHRRMLWCQTCKAWIDRDVNVGINLSDRGLARLASSLPKPENPEQRPLVLAEEKGGADEAMKGNPTKTVILRVDASKLARRPTVNAPVDHPKSRQNL